MPAYRLYFIDGHSGHFVRSLDFGADDDRQAIAKADELMGTMAMELWCGSRKVHHWDPVPAGPVSVDH
jgi:hypothetical protein